MLEFLLFWLFLLVIVLVIAGIWLVQYVFLPGFLLRIFFQSERVPRGLKEVVGWTLGVLAVLLLAGLGWSRHMQERARQQENQVARMPPIRLTVQQPGLRPYPLGRGRIEECLHDTTQLLVVSGDLPDGQRLRARFTATRGSLALFETNVVAVGTDEGAATQATVFTRLTRKRCTGSSGACCRRASGSWFLFRRHLWPGGRVRKNTAGWTGLKLR